MGEDKHCAIMQDLNVQDTTKGRKILGIWELELDDDEEDTRRVMRDMSRLSQSLM